LTKRPDAVIYELTVEFPTKNAVVFAITTVPTVIGLENVALPVTEIVLEKVAPPV
jgi:hypothetical protein